MLDLKKKNRNINCNCTVVVCVCVCVEFKIPTDYIVRIDIFFDGQHLLENIIKNDEQKKPIVFRFLTR